MGLAEDNLQEACRLIATACGHLHTAATTAPRLWCAELLENWRKLQILNADLGEILVRLLMERETPYS
jgi:hypothetical protein